MAFLVTATPVSTEKTGKTPRGLRAIKTPRGVIEQDVWSPRRSAAERGYDTSPSSAGSPDSRLGSSTFTPKSPPVKSRLGKSFSSIGVDTSDIPPESSISKSGGSSPILTRSASLQIEKQRYLTRSSSLGSNSQNSLDTIRSSPRSGASSPALHVVKKSLSRSLAFKKSENTIVKALAIKNLKVEGSPNAQFSPVRSKFHRKQPSTSSKEGSSHGSLSGSSNRSRGSSSSSSGGSMGRKKKERRIYLERPFEKLEDKRSSQKLSICRKPGCDHKDVKTCNRRAGRRF